MTGTKLLVVLAMLWSFTMIPVPKGLEVRG